ncbi:MAG: hypothetical protein MMC23_005859 [Stictis urceolatum]|nr:hypothetical protein [Stictis urceolata]
MAQTAALNILLTGATGYVGGTFLTQLHTQPSLLFPSVPPSSSLSVKVTCLVRTQETADALAEAYPPTAHSLDPYNLRISLSTAIGTLESADLLTQLASASDIVIHTADADHAIGARALLAGVRAAPISKSRSTPNGKAVMIHISGAGNILDCSIPFGALDPRTVSDSLAGASPPLKLPKERMHAALEQELAGYAENEGVQLVELAPAHIYGLGQGRVGKTETFPKEWWKAAVGRGGAFVVGEGKNRYSWSSVRDIARALGWVAGEALRGVDCRIGWGERGYYYVESAETGTKERAEVLGRKLLQMGKAKSAEVEVLGKEEVEEKFGEFMNLIVGSNMRSRADRLKGLGWKPLDLDWVAVNAEGTGERC